MASRWLVVVAAAAAVALAGCSGGNGVAPLRGPPPDGDAPPATTGLVPSTTLPPATSVACPPIPPRAAPSPERPRYTLTVDVRPADRRVDGHLRVRFTPDLDTDRLVFRLWANQPSLVSIGSRLEAGEVTVDGRRVDGSLEDATTLVVRPGGVLAAGRAVEVAMPWSLRLPGPTRDRLSADGEMVRLGSFFPILAWDPGDGWATEPATGGFAEDTTSPTADFDLTVTAPPGLTVLASGVNDRPGHWSAEAMRDVAVAVGRFATTTGVARAPDPVKVTVGVQEGLAESPGAYLEASIRLLEDFARRFGAFPWPAFSVSVTRGPRVGIEYPGHILQGPGTLGGPISHEIGHQWFYGLVGNNQGRDPWLDESLATWAEARAQGTLDRFRSTVLPPAARGRLPAPMTYWAPRRGDYYEGAYVQGAQALAALGDPTLVDCALRVYVADQAHGIARPADLVRAAATVFPHAAATLSGFGVSA